jgi:type IV pilus assembly protein PilC
MSLILTPGQFTQRAEFYYQLSQLTAAGIGLPSALEQLRRNPPARSYQTPISQLLDLLNSGYTLSESLRNLPDWLPEFDVSLLHAGEQSGRLDASFKLLADYYTERARIARQVLGDLAYPAFLFHFAIFILPFAEFFKSGDWVGYLEKTFGILLPVYVVITLVIYAAQSRHGETWRSWIESFCRRIPVLGKARWYLALARLSAALEALLSAGVTIIQAWELAAAASGSPALRRIVLRWRPLVDAGQTPAEVISGCRNFPEMFANQYATGEISGKLDETLRRLHLYYLSEGSRKLQALAQWTPRLVYLGIVFMIAYRIIQFWTGYYKTISDVTGGF